MRLRSFFAARARLLSALCAGVLWLAPEAAMAQRGADTNQDLDAIEKRLEARRKEEARLKDEAAAKAKEIAALRQNMIETAGALQDAEKRIGDISAELSRLTAEETALTTSLKAEQETLGDILGALQSLERSRPPAILVTPEDSATAARTAILLAGAAPELKEKADALRTDLEKLATVKDALDRERAAYQKTNEEVGARRRLLADLLTEKQAERDVAQRLAAAAQSETAALAARASNLRGVLDRLERLARIIVPRIKPPMRRRAGPEAAPSQKPTTSPATKPQKSSPIRVPGIRFRPKVPFAKARGRVSVPVAGDLIGRFGKPKPEGGAFEGVRYAAADGAIVTAPYDASVAFARFYRPTGNLIVLDVGEGYHILLMGVGSFLVDEGQTVAAGEPIAVMTGGDAQLDLEIRSAREPVNPALWLDKDTG
ncbi:MAG: peptidoglycan DD-metalloendopeptidase family protein [Pseudomonadota bacterium]